LYIITVDKSIPTYFSMEGKKHTGKLISFSAGFVFAAIIFASFVTGYAIVSAAWQEPTSPPPANNIAPPLNTGSGDQSKLGGLSIGGVATTSKLCFGTVGDDCQSSWNDILGVWEQDVNGIFYDAGNVAVGPAFTGVSSWPDSWARMFINLGSTGSNREGLYVTRDAYSDYSYLNVEDEIGAPIFRVHQTGNIGIGTAEPNSAIHIASTTGNAEIDIQSVPGTGEHWGIYHDGPNGEGTSDLRFWKSGENRVAFSDSTDSQVSFGGAWSTGVDISDANNFKISNNALLDQNTRLTIDGSGDIGIGGIVTASDFCIAGVGCFTSSIGAVYTGSTAGLHTGDTGGYTAANALCDAEFTDSHVCTSEDILRTINSGLPLATDIVWINNGPPGYTSSSNDCQAKTSSASGENYGAIWLPPPPFTPYPDGAGALAQCDSSYKLSCCK
jgi:hypothetical protein